MKIFHTLTLIAALSLGTAAFAKVKPQTDMNKMPAQASGMSDSMEDQDYSAWKDYFFGFRRGNSYSMFSSSKMMPTFTGIYDEMVFHYMERLFFAEEMIPDRPFDGVLVTRLYENDDIRWRRYEKMANAYRRELMRENEHRMMMMGRSGMGMNGGMNNGMGSGGR